MLTNVAQKRRVIRLMGSNYAFRRNYKFFSTEDRQNRQEYEKTDIQSLKAVN